MISLFFLLLSVVWDYIFGYLGGRRQLPIQSLIPSGWRSIGNNLEFSFFKISSRFVGILKKF
jgi:hypothetical protein